MNQRILTRIERKSPRDDGTPAATGVTTIEHLYHASLPTVVESSADGLGGQVRGTTGEEAYQRRRGRRDRWKSGD